MRGLLRKDGYMTLRYGKFFLAFILIYAGIAALSDMGMLFSLINVMIGGMLVKTRETSAPMAVPSKMLPSSKIK